MVSVTMDYNSLDWRDPITDEAQEHFPFIRNGNTSSKSFRWNKKIAKASIKGLDIQPIIAQIPNVPELFIGREAEVNDIGNLLRRDSNFVLLTGCPGTGKSSLAAAIGHALRDDDTAVPVYINVRGSVSAKRVISKIIRQFNLYFAYQELTFFYRWLNCHKQKLLLIVDHIDAGLSDDSDLANVISNLLDSVKDLKLLCVCDVPLHGDGLSYTHWNLQTLETTPAEDLLRQAVPILEDDQITRIAHGCVRSPLALNLVQCCLQSDSFDDTNLVNLVANNSKVGHKGNFVQYLVKAGISLAEDGHKEYVIGLMHCINSVIELIPEEEKCLLPRLAKFQSGFDMNAVCYAAKNSEYGKADLEILLDIYHKLHLVEKEIIDEENHYYHIPLAVRCVVQEYVTDEEAVQKFYCDYYLERIHELSRMYHSKQSLQSAKFTFIECDNIVDVLSIVMQERDRYGDCVALTEPAISMYLHKALEREFYVSFYEGVEADAKEKGDVVTQSRAACCLANHFIHRGKYDISLQHAERAYEIQADEDVEHKVEDVDKGFCYLCLGKSYWKNEETTHEGFLLIKKAVDLYKAKLGMQNPLTLYAYEMYARVNIEKDSFQTARHYYNVIDLIAPNTLGDHPLLLKGYDSRRAIWDRLLLFGRALEAARTAVRISQGFHGDHPITAKMHSRLCECVIKRGSLQETLETSVSTLSIRLRVLGEHVDTALSYKTLAHLMLRSGYYEKAGNYAQTAINMMEKIGYGSTKYAAECRSVREQAKSLNRQKSLVYVEIEPTKESPKRVNKPPPQDLNVTMSSITSTMSTDV